MEIKQGVDNKVVSKNIFMILRAIFFILIITTLHPCKEHTVSFTEAQPVNKKEIPFFQKKYIGTYKSLSGENNLTIEKELIYENFHIQDTISNQEYTELINDNVNIVESRKINDSQHLVSLFYTDTIFNLKILRRSASGV